MGCSGKSDDISDLFRDPEPGPSQDVGFRQGTIVEFDPDSLENVVDVGGTLLENLPILGSADASLYEPGAVVGIVPVGKSTKTMYVVGRPRTAANPPSGLDAVCTRGSPVRVCLTATPLQEDEVGAVNVYAADDTVSGQYTAGLKWACPGDPVDDEPFTGDTDLPLIILGGVNYPHWSLYEDGAERPSYGPGYGLPEEDHGAFVEDLGRRVADHRWLKIGMARDVGRDWDALDNVVYGQSRLSIGFDEIENEITIYVERPGLNSAGSGDYYPARDAAYVFRPEGLEIVAPDGEADQDAFPLPPPLVVVGDEGRMRIGGRHIYAMDTDDETPVTIVINNLEIDPDGNITTGGLSSPGLQQDTEAVSFTTQTSNTTAVTFDTAFDAAPRVFANIASTSASADGWTVRCANITTAGFDLYVSGPSATWASIPVQWMAIDS